MAKDWKKKRKNLLIKVFLRINYTHFSIDATATDRLARYVNDSPPAKINCKVERKMFGEIPHLCLFAIKDIDAGTELRYNI